MQMYFSYSIESFSRFVLSGKGLVAYIWLKQFDTTAITITTCPIVRHGFGYTVQNEVIIIMTLHPKAHK